MRVNRLWHNLKWMRQSKTLILLIFVMALAAWILYRPEGSERIVQEQVLLSVPPISAEVLPKYIQVATNTSYEQSQQEEITIHASEWSDVSADTVLETKYEEQRTVVYWHNALGYMEWSFQVEEGGTYELDLEYAPTSGGKGSIVRGIQIDGKFPFEEAQTIRWDRVWSDAKFPYDTNAIGNQIRAGQEESLAWRTARAQDYAVSSEPLQFKLSAGEHKLRMVGVREPIVLSMIRLVPTAQLMDYKEYTDIHPTDETPALWSSRLEAEQFVYKSPIGLQTNHISEPHISPDPRGRLVYNTIGGDSWREPGDWAEWHIEVPQSGWYHIDVKYMQGFIGNIGVFRTIRINGQIPFQEAKAYHFSHSPQFRLEPLSSSNDEAFRFWLNKGSNTIRLTADASPHAALRTVLDGIEAGLWQIDRDIRKITGNYGFAAGEYQDVNRTWRIDEYFPNLTEQLIGYHRNIITASDALNSLHGIRTQPGTTLVIAASVLNKLIKDINELPFHLADVEFIRNSLSNVSAELQRQPLLIDYLIVRSTDSATPEHHITIMEKISYTFVQFFRSFYLQYNTKSLNNDESLVVWLQRGRDYANLLQELIDREFTPATGITVNINIMPNPSVLILGNAAGDQPDVALGINMETPSDFAMRGAVSDLSGLVGFDELAEQYHPGVMRSFTYEDGVYAFPEVQSFQLLFYRQDLLEQLGQQPPETWQDVYKLLPDLMENGMQFYYPPKWFEPFFFQHGLEFYSEDGLHTRLGEVASLPAFQQWVDLFRRYDLPKEVPAFFNHFREGDLPIGVADFNTYIQLLVAAPEIAQLWSIAPLPGTVNENGVIERWAPQVATAAMIMRKSDKQEQAWKFLRWWLSADTQESYGNEIEAIKGTEYRWNTANQEALYRLPWPQEHLEVIREQNRWVRNVPYVPGHYFLPRLMDFAWNRTVLEGDTPKEALEQAALSLEREMLRKQRELPDLGSRMVELP